MMPLLAAVLLVQQPAVGDTGAGRPCRVAVDSMGHYHETTNAAGDKVANGGGGVRAHCDGTSTTISADSFAHFAALGRLDLIGRVQIRDTGLALDSHLASYFLRDERLEAHNHVVAVNRLTGSKISGPNLTYWRAAKGIRDTVEMYATSRPTVEYLQGATSDSAVPEPYIIVADRIREDRQEVFNAEGRWLHEFRIIELSRHLAGVDEAPAIAEAVGVVSFHVEAFLRVILEH